MRKMQVSHNPVKISKFKKSIKFSLKFQAQMHECAAKCCYDTESSMDVVQNCVERCTKPVNKAHR